MKHKRIAVAGFTASMLLGAGTGLVLNMPGSVSAASSLLGSVSIMTRAASLT